MKLPNPHRDAGVSPAFLLLILSLITLPLRPQTLVFQNCRLIDGTAAPPRDHITLISRDGLIDSISPAAQAVIPPGSTIIDATNKTIIPTLVLCHAHLGLVEGNTSTSNHLTPANVLRQLHLYARYGIGAVASLGLDHDFIFNLRDHLPQGSPRLLTAGHGFTAPKGGPPPTLGDQLFRPTTPDEARADVDQLALKRVDLIKIWLDDFGGSAQRIQPDIYRAIIDQAHHDHLRVAAHVYYLADAKAILSAGVDILAHSVRDQPVDDDFIQLMKAHDAWLIPTLDMIEVNFIYADQPDWMKEPFFVSAVEPGVLDMLLPPRFTPKNTDRRVLKTAQQNLKTLYAAGVKIAFGTDTGASPIRVQGFGEHRELELMVQAGLTPLEAIQCATQTSANLLGILPSTGTLEPGKQTNLILLNADPTKDIHNTHQISSVYLNGKKVD